MNAQELENKKLELVSELKNVERSLQKLFEEYCEQAHNVKIGSIVRAFGRNLTIKKLYKINRFEFTKPNILGIANEKYEELVTADHWELVTEE
jgi:hypothetical protein